MPLLLRRDEFLDEYWDYEPGQHVSLIQPTGGGKTHLAYQLADRALRQNPQLSFMSLMPKPKSPSTEQWAAKLNLREVDRWPAPARMFWEPKPRGHVLWPKHRKDLPAAERRALVATQLRKGMNYQYWKGDSITFADDLHVLAALMGLNPEVEEHLTAGREGGAGLWAANQKPSGTASGGAVTTYFYSAPTHLFLGSDNDERNVKRFSEIGAVDPKEIASIVRSLRLYSINGSAVSDQLYIDKRGPYLAIVQPW